MSGMSDERQFSHCHCSPPPRGGKSGVENTEAGRVRRRRGNDSGRAMRWVRSKSPHLLQSYETVRRVTLCQLTTKAYQFSRAERRAAPRCGLNCFAVEAPPAYTFTELHLRVVCVDNPESSDSGEKSIEPSPRIANGWRWCESKVKGVIQRVWACVLLVSGHEKFPGELIVAAMIVVTSDCVTWNFRTRPRRGEGSRLGGEAPVVMRWRPRGNRNEGMWCNL